MNLDDHRKAVKEIIKETKDSTRRKKRSSMKNKLAEPANSPSDSSDPNQPPNQTPIPAWYSRMNWLGVIVIAIGVMEYLKLNVDILQNPSWDGLISIGIGVLIIVLRYFTSTPIATVQQLKMGQHKK